MVFRKNEIAITWLQNPPLPYATDTVSDSACWLQIDLGQRIHINRSELCFVRPTAGHAYVLEGSVDGKKWKRCDGHADVQKRSPHIDDINASFRYLRVRITDGIRGIWEWRIL